MQFILHPDATVPPTSSSDFLSMSVTRAAGRGAVVTAEPPLTKTLAVRPTLVVSDIPGAQPTAFHPPRRGGAAFHDPADVEGARPRQLHRALAYAPEHIEGSTPLATSFRTKRRTDPVNPAYELPSAAEPVPITLPYKRDTALTNDDIPGSKPRAHLPWSTRPDHTSVSDIAGTSARPRTLSWQHEHVDASLDVRDINSYRTFRSQRRSDPQRPAFAVHGRVIADDDPGMFVTRPRPPADHPDYSLTTADIAGAECPKQGAEYSVGGIKPADRRHYRVTNFIGDIAGSEVGSRKKGLTTLRGTDAQERDYVLLDGRTLDASELTVGKSWYGAAATLVAAAAGELAATPATLSRSSLAAGVAPYVSYAKRVLDPVAAEVARLRGEVAVLRKERDLSTLRLATAAGSGAGVTAQVSASGGESGMGAAGGGATHGASTAASSMKLALPLSQTQRREGDPPPTSSRLASAYGVPFGGEGGDGAGAGAGAGNAASLSSTLADTSAAALSASMVAGHVPRPPMSIGGTSGAGWVERARWGADSVRDPIAALRSTAAAASVRNLLGVLPATRPPLNDYASGGLTLRASTGKFDRSLDSAPATERPAPTLAGAASATAGARGAVAAAKGGVVYSRTLGRSEARAASREVAEVAALPSQSVSAEPLDIDTLAAAPPQRNVIFFICDDMRPQLNAAYGKPEMHTPHFDKFAASATVFDFAFSNFAICSPSRNSFMTGRSPDKTRVWNFRQDFRQAGVGRTGLAGSDWVSLPQYFKQHGYLTLGHGKLYHPGKPPKWDEPKSWSQLQPYGPEHITGCGAKENFCPKAGSPNAFSDYNTTTEAITTLGIMVARSRAQKTPFFLGVGMHYPHQPWNTQVDLSWEYPPATIGLAAPTHPETPVGAPDVALSAELDGNDHISLNWTNPHLCNRTHDPDLPASVNGFESFPCPSPGNATVPPYFTQYMRLGYYTAVSASDAHFGMLMAALEASGEANNTLVVLGSDHGWAIGEHGHFGKHTNFDLSVHVPLIIRAPWLPASSGAHVSSYVELLDLYRSVAALAGLPPPPPDVEGDDFSPLLGDPSLTLKTEAYAQYSRCPGERFFPTVSELPDWALNNCEDVPVANITYMGYTIRLPAWRFTEWYRWSGTLCVAEWESPPHGTELYSHAGHTEPGDFDNYENVNVADVPANAATVTALRAKLWARFKSAGSGCPPDQPGSLEWPHAPWRESE